MIIKQFEKQRILILSLMDGTVHRQILKQTKVLGLIGAD